MSGGKGGSTTQKTTIDPRLTDALLNNNAQSQWVANQLGARQFADFTPDQLAAFDQLRGAGGWGMDALQQAMAAMQGAANYDPQMVQAGSLLDMDLSAYMNPYTSQVVDTALADIDRFGQMQQAQNAAAAQKAGAFGGSRHGVVEAETNRAMLDQAARTASGLRSSAFDSAMGFATGDLQRQLQAALANQGAGLSAAQMALAGGMNLGQLAQLEQQMRMLGAQAQGDIGAMQQALEQQRLDALRNLPLEQQQIRNTAMGLLSPLAGNSTTTQSQQAGWGQLLGQGLSLGLMFSDERVKADIDDIDGDEALEKLNLLSGHEYRYKGDTTRTGGVMAQDVEKVMPEAVVSTPGGIKAVDYGRITGLLVEAVKELDNRTRGAA